MSKLPRCSGKEMLALLIRYGFSVVRVRGSHHVLQNGALRTVVPVHGNEVLKLGTLRGIMRDAEISPDELRKRLK